jgi:hypothetical protein
MDDGPEEGRANQSNVDGSRQQETTILEIFVQEKGTEVTKSTKGEDSKTKNWRYIPPKDGEPTEKFVKNKITGKKEKRMWCANPKCHHWTNSHSTEQHGAGLIPSSTPVKAGDLQLQSSLKTFMSKATGNPHLKKDQKQLKTLLSQMLHDESKNDGSIDSD